MMFNRLFPLIIFLAFGTVSWSQYDIKKLAGDVKNAKPGDTIVVAAGTYADAALVLQGQGAKNKPIVIIAEKPGAVKLTGNSYVRLAGEHLEFNGFHFTNGFTTGTPVVEFRRNKENLANNCRVTNCVIDNYSKPERFNTDSWIVFWGKNNRFDHNTIGDKLNGGTTLIVNLDDERSQQNFHSIDSNYFAGRQRLGSNGGETIRVGVSRYSLTASNTNIAYNFFEHVNGEVEIISLKSGNNHVHHNTFYECEGGLVLRHGSENIIESNVFIGNNKPHTGGIRVINPGHKVFNNLLVGLAGERFRAAFSVLNGVPNSLINRYYQVTDATIYNNSFINSSNIIFGAGKDAERTLGPKNVTFSNNFIATKKNTLFEDANRDGGITFSNNSFYGSIITPAKGFTAVRVSQKDWSGFQIPVPANKTGADLSKLTRMDASTTGASWYKKPAVKSLPRNTIQLKASQAKELPSIIARANDGDVFVLEHSASPYEMSAPITVNKNIEIRTEAGNKKVEFVNVHEKSLPAFIVIENGGTLSVSGIKFSGTYLSFGDVHAGIATTTKPMNRPYKLYVNNCEFYKYNESSQSGIKATKSTIADTVIVTNSLFRNISGTGIDFSAEKEDKGIYNVERLEVKNTVFTNLLGAAIVVYRGGNDESTTGPSVLVEHCVFNEVNNMEQGVVVKLLGAQEATITNNIFSRSGQGGRTIWFEENSWDKLKVDYNNFFQSGRVQSFYGKAVGKNVFKVDPQFINVSAFNFKLKENSPLLGKGSDDKAVGLTEVKSKK